MRRSALTLLLAGPLLAACGLSIVGVDIANDAGLPDATSVVNTTDSSLPDAGPTIRLEPSTSVIGDSETFDLTQLGTLDWVFYGVSPPIRKAGGGMIEGYTPSDAASGFYTTGNTCSWSDGTPPNGTATNNAGLALFDMAPVDLVFTVQAEATPMVFGLQLGGSGSVMSVEADLGGRTTTTSINTDEDAGQYRERYALTFSASPPQPLTVKVHLIDCIGSTCSGGHFFAFNAATLATP